LAEPIELIIDEVRRRFEHQGARLDDVRTRSGALLASAAVVTTLFGFRLGGITTAFDLHYSSGR
jgi:hypothetical protein